MSENDSTDKLAERMARMRPAPAKRHRAGINPYALSAVTAVAGVGLGAWLVLAAPEAEAPEAEIRTASVTGFQDDGAGTEGFRFARMAPQDPPPVPDPAEENRLQKEIETLKAQIADLKANPVTITDDAALQALKAKVTALDTEARLRETALADLERENIRLQTALETRSLIAGQGADDAARLRQDELARKRKEAQALRQAQIQSDMVALRTSGGMAEAVAAAAPNSASGGDEAFRRAGAQTAEVRQAEVIANPSFTIVQGSLIEASLETAIDTDLAGHVTAVVSHDVWSFDMSRVLIPRGSRLFGRYGSDVAPGQRRVLIAWDRLVTTDGQSVALAAYGTDRIGRSGLPGRVRNHFLQRFGTAALISVIGAVPTLAAAHYENETASETAENVGTDLGEAVSAVMADFLRIPSTISVDQGAVVMVRVDTDLELFP